MTGAALPLPRVRAQAFFSSYWGKGSSRIVYRYQWFLRACRARAFSLLETAPHGPILELGAGQGSTEPGEDNPASITLDIIPLRTHGRHAVVADAQVLPFRDCSLGAVWCQTTLMHVTPAVVAREASRVLVPGGIFVVVEPLSGHPLVRVVRPWLPGRRSHPIFPSLADVEAMGSWFRSMGFQPFFLLSPIMLLWARRRSRLVAWLQAFDARLLARYPHLGRFAWYVVAWYRK